MAKITISGLPKAGNNAVQYLYTDLHLDLQTQYLLNDNLHQRPEINDLRADHDIDAIKNSIRTLFNTAPGNRILDPEWGLDLRRFLFEPITTLNAAEIQRAIFLGLPRSEPRVGIQRVVVTPDIDSSEYNIDIMFSVPTLNIYNLSVFGILNTNGYNFV